MKSTTYKMIGSLLFLYILGVFGQNKIITRIDNLNMNNKPPKEIAIVEKGHTSYIFSILEGDSITISLKTWTYNRLKVEYSNGDSSKVEGIKFYLDDKGGRFFYHNAKTGYFESQGFEEP